MQDVKEKKSLHSPSFSLSNKISRTIWGFVYLIFFRFSPRPLFAYRRFILSMFGASLARGVRIYPSVKIWLPANLSMADESVLGPDVNVYNQGHITIGSRVIISQGAHLCASTHDYNDPLHPLLLAPIAIASDAWICADAFVGPYVHIENGAVLGARSVAMKSLGGWNIYAGNPAVKVKERTNFSVTDNL